MDGGPADAFDVVIVGGGPAGCAAALALAQRGRFRIMVVEAGRYEAVRIGESVPPDIRPVLEQLGLWQDFLADDHEPCLGSCSSWGADGLGYNDFLFNPLGHGWHLDRRRFDACLARQVAKRGIALHTATRFDGGERLGAGGFRLRLSCGDRQTRTVMARCVVDATGTRAAFARNVGVGKRVLDRLLCVTGFFEHADGAELSKLTLLEAVAYGWWYAARLPQRRLVVAVASDPGIIRGGGLRRRDGWLRGLEQTKYVAPLLSGCRLIAGSQVIGAAPSFILDRVAGDGWLAVGDAASAYDPISSQGIHKALSDGIRAADAIAASLDGSNAKLGDYQAAVAARFEQYREQRDFFYGLERRWPTSPFWTRRQATTAVRPAPQMPAA